MRPALALPFLGIAMLLAGCTDAIQLEAELSTTRAELTDYFLDDLMILCLGPGREIL